MIKLVTAVLLVFSLTAMANAAPTRVKGSDQEKNLVKKVVPKYPPEAKAKGISGKVRLEAIIAKDGSIKELRVMSGEEVLATAALEAVKQWVYTPTLQNGEPVEVITDIDVNFTLSK